MNKKITYLFLALLLPVLVFVFLKYFGKNEFDIPVYYSAGVSADTLQNECRFTVRGQYYVADSVLKKWNRKGSVILFSFSRHQETEWMNELIKDGKLEFLQQVCWNCGEDKLKDCIFFLKEPYNAVLIDDQRRIRGYYKLGNREEMDRLEVELKILLKKY
ncbi:MAG: hypothetical protein HY015_07250 [Bacteroidetes bacterium]|nr:hypothetical protein [Bacteroidota bacterium]MBI3482759.1 hypothetical protein [Bacteroidota bacterium]